MTALAKNDQAHDDESFLALASAERIKSDDPKSRHVLQSGVGAVIVKNGQVISRSANVLPPKLRKHNDREGLAVQEAERYHFIEHAERAAIYNAFNEGLTLEGSTMYCTRYPCSDCARAIVWAGISRLVVATGLTGEERWLESQRAARDILKRSGVTLRILGQPE